MSTPFDSARPSAGGTSRAATRKAHPPARSPRSPSTARRVSRTVLLAYLSVVTALTAVYALHPGEPRGLLAYVTISLTVSAVICWGINRYRPTVRTGWFLLAGAPALGGVGMVSRRPLAGTTGVLVPLIPDVITIAAYLLLIAALFSFLRARRGAGADSALDGGLMAVAALLLSWAVLIQPVLADADLPGPVKVVNGAYPTISVAVLFLGALLAMTEVRGLFVFWTLAVAWVGLATGDLVYALASVGTTTLPLWLANCAYCGFYALLGVAALHPSMVSLGRPAPKRVRGYGSSRFVSVSVALLVPAAVVTVRPPAGTGERLICGGLFAFLGILVLVRTAGAVNRHATSEVRLERLANADPLTGLPNRLGLSSHLEQALSRAHSTGRGVGVLCLDLDQFKTVNDNWGHETGDELLTVVALRFTTLVRGGELIARVGGDEFVVVCEDIAVAEEALGVARRMLAELEHPVALRSANVPITSSVGVTVAWPADRRVSVEDLLREADTAMYRAKSAGGDDVVLFDESMRVEIAARFALEGSLRGALGRGELQLYYQPIVDLRTGTTTGFEALMRWQHPELGLVAPDRFIPVAEETGLILPIGRWAIEEATAQLGTWIRTFLRPLTMSVNISARQIRDPALIPTVTAALVDNGVPGPALCLEVTETTLMDDAEATLATVASLKALGVRLSADDFGTGYSSLAYLRQYPFDEVKVDRSFVSGLGRGGDDDVIVGAVISMASALSLSTVAEGVETAEQRERLLRLGAQNAQGWLFAAALPAAEATARLHGLPDPRRGENEPPVPAPSTPPAASER